jgi:hypothetical protein
MDFIPLLMSYVDVGSVLLGVIGTHFIRYLLPSPKGDTSKFAVGPIAYRCLPFIPLIIGAATVVVKDGLVTPTLTVDESVVKGIVSGAVAAYLFRTTKIVIFGKQENGENKETVAEETKGLVAKLKELMK